MAGIPDEASVREPVFMPVVMAALPQTVISDGESTGGIAPLSIADDTAFPDAMPVLPVERDTDVRILRIVDGISMETDWGIVRLSGLREPEGHVLCQTLSGQSVSCQQRAQTQLELLTRSRRLHCRRTGAVVIGGVPVSCQAGSVNIAHWMARQGWAVADDPTSVLASLSREAQKRELGMWRK